jgi:hypothetical protein
VYFGWDIARGLEIVGADTPCNYIYVDGMGGLHWTDDVDISGFPSIPLPGFDIVKDMEVYKGRDIPLFKK